MKKQILLFILMILPMMASADDSGSCGENLTWSYVEATKSLTISGTGAMNNFNYNYGTSMPWKSYLNNIEVIIIESGVASIGNSAFSGCRGLTSVTIPNSVTSIGDWAFQYCSGLTSITIPKSVTNIAYSLFSGCSGLTSVDIPSSVTSIGNSAFSGCSGLTSVVIPSSVTSIGDYAFYNCSSLTSVTIPNNVTSIGGSAFKGTAWYDIWYNNQPDGLVYVGKVAYKFKGEMPANTELIIRDGTTLISDGIFSDCTGLTSVIIPNSVTSIGGNAFRNCRGLTSVNIPNSVTYIGSDAFYKCSALTSLTIPNSVTSLGSYAFAGCSGLTSVTIPNSVTSIANSLFSGCSGLTSVDIPSGVTSIGENSFINCSSLTSVIIPNGVTSIGRKAFKGCSSLTSIEIPNSLTSIAELAFSDCTSLKSVNISDLPSWCIISFFDNSSNPLNYAYHLFLKGEEIHDLVIPEGVTSIGNYAFYNCKGLTSVSIPNSVTSIGYCAFDGCDNLESSPIPERISKRIIHVEKAGSLYSLISGGIYQIENLTLTGEINGSDLSLIREMAGKATGIRQFGISSWDEFADTHGNLSVLDMSGVKIVSGGGYLFLDGGVDQGDAWVELVQDDVIPAGLFCGCKKLTSISIPSGLKNIGSEAFDGTGWYENQPDGLVYIGNVLYKYKGEMPDNTHLTIKDGTVGIANAAFYGQSSLSSITIPKSMKYIGVSDFQVSEYVHSPFYSMQGKPGLSNSDVFTGCSGLASVKISDLSSWLSIEFDDNSSNPLSYAHHLYLNEDELTELIIPNNIKSINNFVFTGCSGLTSVTIPAGVTAIGYSAFYSCIGLSSINIPSSVTSIGYSAFGRCYNLTSIIVESDNPNYDSRNNCNAIIEKSSNTLITGCNNTIIPNGVTAIGSSAFWDCSGLASITIPAGVTAIGSSAFYGCSGLSSITIPAGVTAIEYYTFNGCSGLTSVNIPNSVTYISTSAFSGCIGLTSIISEIENPFNITSNVFMEVHSDARLIVPKGTKAKYQATEGWNQFTNIVEAVDGDANGDEEVNQADVENVESFIMGETPTVFVRSAADMNGDEKIDVVDIVLMQNIIKK